MTQRKSNSSQKVPDSPTLKSEVPHNDITKAVESAISNNRIANLRLILIEREFKDVDDIVLLVKEVRECCHELVDDFDITKYHSLIHAYENLSKALGFNPRRFF